MPFGARLMQSLQEKATGNPGSQRLLALQRQAARAALAHPARPVLQRQITVERVDYNPDTGEYRDGFVNQAAFYVDLRTRIGTDAGIAAGHKNIRNDVLGVVSATDFERPSVIDVREAILAEVIQQYGNRGRPLGSAPLLQRFRGHIEAALVANLQPDHAIAMDAAEQQGFDQLAQSAGVVMSRAKGVPNTLAHANLPGVVRGRVDAVLGEIRAERALWTVGALTTAMCVPENSMAWSGPIAGRQRGLHYQGNHSNNAGWLPAVPAPPDHVAGIGNRILQSGQMTRRLRNILTSDNPEAGLRNDSGARRVLFEQLKAAELGLLTDAMVKDSALASLCQGVSAYVEFNLPGGVSRLVFNPTPGANRVYLSAHYKWRQGYNPFFQITGFPAV